MECCPDTLASVTFSNVSSVDHNLVFLGQITARTSAIVAPGRAETRQGTVVSPHVETSGGGTVGFAGS